MAHYIGFILSIQSKYANTFNGPRFYSIIHNIHRAHTAAANCPNPGTGRTPLGVGKVPLGVRYTIGCILGIHAKYTAAPDDPDSWPLFSVRNQISRDGRVAYGMTWCERVIIDLAGLAQAIAALFLLYRRGTHADLLPLEWRNGVVAVGGGSAAIISLGVLLLDTTWTIQLPATGPVRRPVQSSILFLLPSFFLSGWLEMATVDILCIDWRGRESFITRTQVQSSWIVVTMTLLSLFWGAGGTKLKKPTGLTWYIIPLFWAGVTFLYYFIMPMIVYFHFSRVEFALEGGMWKWEDPLASKLWAL